MNRFAKSAGLSAVVGVLLCFLALQGTARAGLVGDGAAPPKPSEAEERPVFGGTMPEIRAVPAAPAAPSAPAVAPNPAGGAAREPAGIAPSPQKAPTLDDLSHDFSSQALGGQNKPPADRQPASPAQDALPLDAVPLSDVRNMLKDLSQVDTVNGLGEAVGLANKVKAGVGGVMGGKGEGAAINGLGERVGGPSSAASRAREPQGGADGYGERAGGSRPVDSVPQPGWLSSVLDTVHDVAGFARDNAILVIVCCLLVLGVTGMAQRKR